MKKNTGYLLFIPVALIMLLPIIGAAAAGKPIGAFLQFPPKPPDNPQPPFSWPVFIGLAIFILAATAPLVLRFFRHKGFAQTTPPVNPFPWWGWAGVALGAISWIIAWSRFPWMGELQAHTFTPLWISFILVANAFLHRKTGRCPLVSKTREFLLLFPASAFFWWSFEYLNRFLGNWTYTGGRDFSSIEYIVFATLPFSTVLPAVLTIRELIFSSPRFDAAFRNWRPVSPTRPQAAALALAALLVSCFGLVAIGFIPDIVFPLVWVAPPLLLLSFSAFLGRPQALSPIAKGDWRCFVASSFAALFCGLFWEMWNNGSAMIWVYEIPYVDAFDIFEMPLLGYAGYLPFGILCAQIGNLILDQDSFHVGG